jgi:hypothetical protein
MIIYKDLISGDEFFSDTYPMKLLHDVVYEVEGKQITVTEGDVDIGANPSAEGGDDEGVDPSSVSGVNIVLANRLVETTFKKKDYQIHIKDFMKKVKERLESEKSDEVDSFMKGAAKFVKEVLGDFSEYQFFLGEKMDADGMVALMKWDGETPKMYFFKHALDAEKV